MRSTGLLALLLLPLPLLTGCPAEDPADDGSVDSDPSTSADPPAETDTDPVPPAPETDTDPVPPRPDTDTDPVPPDTDTDPVPPDPDTEGNTETPGTILGCECIVDDALEGTSETPSAPLCGESNCPNVSASCASLGCSDEFEPAGGIMLGDPEALTCALTALRDRTPGMVTWSLSQLEGQYDNSGYVVVNDDGTAVRRSWGWSDLDYNVSDAVLGALPPADHFDACLAEADPLARFDCLRGALASMDEICDAGWYYGDF